MTTKGPSSDTLQLRRGTAAEWTAADPVLSLGEVGWERDTNELKIGDGSTAWTSLPYFAGTDIVPGDLDLGTPTPPRQQSFLYTNDAVEPNEFTLQAQLSMYKSWSGQALYDDAADTEDLVAGFHVRQDYDRDTPYTGGAFGGEYVAIMGEEVHNSIGGPQLGSVGIYGASFSAIADTDQDEGFMFGGFSSATMSGAHASGNVDTAVGWQAYVTKQPTYTGTISLAAASRVGLFLSGASGSVTTAYYYTAYPFNITASVGSIYGYHMRDLRGEATNVWAIRTLGGDVEHDNGNLIMSTDTVTDQVYQAKTTGASFSRYQVDASGTITWGPGAVAVDVNLYRSAANILKTDDSFYVGANHKIDTDGTIYTYSILNFSGAGPLFDIDGNTILIENRTDVSNVPLSVQGMAAQSGDLQQWKNSTPTTLLAVGADGKLLFGSAQDTNLYRAAADMLATDDDLRLNNAKTLYFKDSGGTARNGIHWSAGDILQIGSTLSNGISFFGSNINFAVDGITRALIDGNGQLTLDLADSGVSRGLAFGSAEDTNLYRAAANQLATDDTFTAIQLRAHTTAATDDAFLATVVGDFFYRFIIDTDGTHHWGSGSGAIDTNLYRIAANTLATDDALYVLNTAGGLSLLVESATSGTDTMWSRVVGDTSPRFSVEGQGILRWGSGSAAADTNLYRSAANTLKTDDSFIVDGGALSLTSGSDIHLGDTSQVQAFDTALSTSVRWISYVIGDSAFRHQVDIAGKHEWGSGSSAVDTNLYRTGVGALRSDSTLLLQDTATAGDRLKLYAGNVSGLTVQSTNSAYIFLNTDALGADDRNYGFRVNWATNIFQFMVSDTPNAVPTHTIFWADKNTKMWLGDTQDTNLYRSAANTLKTDDNFEALSVTLGGDLKTTADVYARFGVAGDTRMGALGPSSQAGFLIGGDVNLYRNAVDELKTDDNFTVAGDIVTALSVASYGGGFNAVNGAFIASALALATTTAFDSYVSGDVNLRYLVQADGKIIWGDGIAAQDTNLYRSAANTLKTDDDFHIAGDLYFPSGTSPAIVATGGAVGNRIRFLVEDTGGVLIEALNLNGGATTPSTLEFGAARDTNLYRVAADRLKTDDDMDIAGYLNLVSATSFIQLSTDTPSGSGGKLYFGNSADTNLYRSAANILKTDDAFVAALTMTAAGTINSAAEVNNAVVTPAQIVANVNNYNPGGAWPAVSTIRASSDATRTITGLDATGVVDGQEVVFENVGANRFTISPENASSTATNRFTLSGASNVTLQNDASIIFKYDGTSQRWRVTGRNFAINTSAPNSVTIDGTNTAGDAGIADARNHIHTFASYSSTPAAVAPTGAAGTSATAPSRGDHSHAGVAVTGGGGETVKAVGATGTTETIALTATDGNVQTMTVDANCVFTMPSGLAAGARRFTLILTDSGGPRNITFTGVLWSGGTEPTAMSGAGAIDTFNFLTINGGTTWYGFTGGLAMAT